MEKSFRFLIFIFLLVLSFNLYSQDTILVLSGEKIVASNIELCDSTNEFSYLNHKNKIKNISLEGVFSIIDSKGVEKVYYTADSIKEPGSFLYSESEMRDYMKGRITAKKEKKEFATAIGGIIVSPGALAPPFIIPIIPVVYIAAVSVVPASQSCIIKKYPEFSENEPFILGYKDAAEAKRTKNAIIGGTTGMVLGIIAKIIYDSVKE